MNARECPCPACQTLSTALDRHVKAIRHLAATRDEVERAGRAADAAHGFSHEEHPRHVLTEAPR